jgi:periplasmic protein TonB
MIVEAFNTLYLRFLAVSIALHLAMFFFVYLMPTVKIRAPETIPVSILESPSKEQDSLTRIPKTAPTRRSNLPALIAKKDSPRPHAKSDVTPENKKPQNENVARADSVPPAVPIETPAPRRETVPEQSVIAERPLPTLKELLPPVTWSSNARESRPISLNSKDPLYVSYFTKIKQLIESQWEYPELALRYGLQGRLSLEFTIGANGQLERLRLVRSSGSQLLDDEALRAIKAAAPFPPIPAWIKLNPLAISAAMEYQDHRVNYQFAR